MVWSEPTSTASLTATGAMPSCACRFRHGGTWFVFCAKEEGLLQVCSAQKANAVPKSAVMPNMQTPQDMVKVFAETQKNMMELNR